ncbi:MAG: tRNA uridine(34) 5-carboxymethylaminomethyl modification radical SAM/GNAT enzyme Elp3 [Candidatus Bathyarchaeia archaeon]
MSTSIYREIIEYLKSIPKPTDRDVQVAKIRVAEKYGLSVIPPNSEIIKYLRADEKQTLLKVLRRKIVRTISGVTVIAVMTKPWPCPQKEPCAYCPGGPAYGVPQSYTGREPATMRGLQFNFDPYSQVRHRIEQLEAIGHMVDKIELIVMGGTFPAMPVDYQLNFIKKCLDAMTGVRSSSLEEAKRNAEVSPRRNVGITAETRPDWCKEPHVDVMLSYGTTRVEIGVQNIYDDIYALINRGHGVKDVIEATRVAKDAGLKVVYHMMPGLPGSDFNRDLDAFKRIFIDSNFKPDMLKIYPCLVVKGTKVYDWWAKGLYNPYTTEEAARLIAEVKKIIPEWVRIMRVQRDIPAYMIEAGPRSSNLREIALRMLREEGLRCRCIRCREAGHKWLKDHVKPDPNKIEIIVRRYEASMGEEFFISAEDPVNDVLIGYLRLRIPSSLAHRPEIAGKDAAIIRELKVVGPLVPVGRRPSEEYQHKGFGRILLERAEEISANMGCKKILVTSALGTKKYYMRFGYNYDGPYVSKSL